MNCENILCVYEKDGHCILDEIELDIHGQCKECIYVELNLKELDTQKAIQLIQLFESEI